MAFDIVFPKNNENDFLLHAKLLGYDSLIFVYSYDYYVLNEVKLKKILSSNLISNYKKGIKIGVLCSVEKCEKLKQKGVLTFVDVSNMLEYRSVLESGFVDCVFGFGKGKKKYLHVRNSGLNQIYCRFLTNNNILLAQNMQEFNFSSSNVWENVIQNAFFSEKYLFRMSFFSFAQNFYQMSGNHDLIAFSKIFGQSHKKIVKSRCLDFF